jgi:hypothetical protein
VKTDELLNLIAAVDPTDRAALDVINGKFHIWRLGLGDRAASWFKSGPRFYQICGTVGETIATVPADMWNVTGSRDAIKAHRPRGWYTYAYLSWDGYAGRALTRAPRDHDEFTTHAYKTEELAELYVVILTLNQEKTDELQST